MLETCNWHRNQASNLILFAKNKKNVDLTASIVYISAFTKSPVARGRVDPAERVFGVSSITAWLTQASDRAYPGPASDGSP
jgi:hypothetical protein